MRSALQPLFQGHGSEMLSDLDNTPGPLLFPPRTGVSTKGQTVPVSPLEHKLLEGRVSLGC